MKSEEEKYQEKKFKERVNTKKLNTLKFIVAKQKKHIEFIENKSNDSKNKARLQYEKAQLNAFQKRIYEFTEPNNY